MSARPRSTSSNTRASSRAGHKPSNNRPSSRLGVDSNNNGGNNNAEKRQIVGQYMLGKTIGEGTFGKVKLAAHMPTGEKVAVKILEKNRIKEAADVRRVNREIKILKKARHGNIIQLYEVLDTQNTIYLIMECCEGGEMFDFIVANKRVAEAQACSFFHQIVDGVDELHRNEITHRDLKPENLLLKASSDGWIVKVVDFGLSNTHEAGRLLATACGSPCYAAPEMIAGKKYQGPLADIWSMGVILFALVAGYLPFEDANTAVLYKKILAGDYSCPRYVSETVRDLIGHLLTVDPRQRYTMADIRRHPWYLAVKETDIPRDLDVDSNLTLATASNQGQGAGGQGQQPSSTTTHPQHSQTALPQLPAHLDAEVVALLTRPPYLLDQQALLDGLASHACNGLTAMYYLFAQKLRHARRTGGGGGGGAQQTTATAPTLVAAAAAAIPPPIAIATATAPPPSNTTNQRLYGSMITQPPGPAPMMMTMMQPLGIQQPMTQPVQQPQLAPIQQVIGPYLAAPPLLQLQQAQQRAQQQSIQQPLAQQQQQPLPSLDAYLARPGVALPSLLQTGHPLIQQAIQVVINNQPHLINPGQGQTQAQAQGPGRPPFLPPALLSALPPATTTINNNNHNNNNNTGLPAANRVFVPPLQYANNNHNNQGTNTAYSAQTARDPIAAGPGPGAAPGTAVLGSQTARVDGSSGPAGLLLLQPQQPGEAAPSGERPNTRRSRTRQVSRAAPGPLEDEPQLGQGGAGFGSLDVEGGYGGGTGGTGLDGGVSSDPMLVEEGFDLLEAAFQPLAITAATSSAAVPAPVPSSSSTASSYPVQQPPLRPQPVAPTMNTAAAVAGVNNAAGRRGKHLVNNNNSTEEGGSGPGPIITGGQAVITARQEAQRNKQQQQAGGGGGGGGGLLQ